MEKKKWYSPQAVIVLLIIVSIFAYICLDVFYTKPEIKRKVYNVENQYKELSTFLDKKIPEIDSTFKEHATQIDQTKEQMTSLEKTFESLEEK
jgi:peptidoglycan hydrolase CwlO-like protein